MRDMREDTTTEPFVVRRTGLGTTLSILYFGALLVGLEILLTVACVLWALFRNVPVRQPLEAIWLSWSGTPWDQVHGICRVERHWDNGEGGEGWDPYLIVMTHPEDELDRSSKTWGPSRSWPGSKAIMGKPLDLDALVEAVKRHAPHIPVTDRGRVPE
jgi:hypothetical protein